MFKVLLASLAFAVATNALEGGRRYRRGGGTFGLVSGDESAREGGEYHCDCGAERTRRGGGTFGLVAGDAAAMEGDQVGTCADPGRVRRSRRGGGTFGLVAGDEAPVEGAACCCMCCCDAGSRQRRGGSTFGLVAGDEAAMEGATCGTPGRRQRRGGSTFGLVSGDESAREGGENDVCACDASSAPQMASAATGSVSDAVLNQLLASNQQLTNALAVGNNGINSVAASTSSATNNPNMNDTELALLVVILVLVIVGVGIVCMSYQQASAANLNQMIQAAIQNEQSTFKADVTRDARASAYSTYSVGDV